MTERLTCESDGTVVLATGQLACPTLTVAAERWWQIEVQAPSQPWQSGEVRGADALGRPPRVEAVAEGVHLVWDSLGDELPFCAIGLDVLVAERDGEVELTARLHNGAAGWTVRHLSLPAEGGLTVRTVDAELLWPAGLGQRFGSAERFGRRVLDYPSGTATMPWLALAGSAGGLYVGSHDPTFGPRLLAASWDAEGLRLGVTHQPFCPSATAWHAPPLVLSPYAGAWQVAASRYRRWFDSQVAVLAAPPWVRQCSGWLLAVLKQQHGEVMWDYRTGLDELCDLALERGLDVLGLFGWAHGGHDGRYPEHYPDPLMGGAPALRAALTRARERGLRTILYANGSLIDTATDFYRYVGNEALALRENRELYLQSIRKFHSATPVTFAMGCLGAEAWRRQSRSLAQQALELGADGILFDQLGVFGPLSCFATHHRHATPAEAFTRERVSLLSEIAVAMRQQNPEFVVATEGVIDALAGAVGFYHGWGTGFAQPTAPQHMFAGDNAFGDLFRATFPELVMTQRQANPMTTRAEAHYALVHGLRHEIETRYPADVRYLREGRLPDPADYADCAYYPPDVETVRSLTANEAAACLQALTAFGQRHAAFLRHGRFVGERGFTNASSGLVAKAFTAGDQLAVCVWNPTAEARPCEISVPNGRLVSCAEPHSETVDPASPMGAETVRLLVFAR